MQRELVSIVLMVRRRVSGAEPVIGAGTRTDRNAASPSHANCPRDIETMTKVSFPRHALVALPIRFLFKIRLLGSQIVTRPS